jgi:putative hydrolase of the HAD superfamily
VQKLEKEKKAIIFDLDNTLIMEDNGTKKAFYATCTGFQELSEIDLEKLFRSVCHRAEELWKNFYLFDYCDDIQVTYLEALCADFLGDDPRLKDLHTWAPTYRRQSWYSALLDQGIDHIVLAEKLGEKYRVERRNRFYQFPGAAPVLEQLMKRYHLAMLTNGTPDLQREKIKKAGLEDYFQVIVVSGEIGVGKPNSQIFRVVLEKLNISPESAVMVGDNLDRDISGAKKAGITAVWFNYEKNTSAVNKEFDYEINRLTELIDLDFSGKKS